MHCMLIRPTAEELKNFGSPDWVIYNAGEFPADPNVPVLAKFSLLGLCFVFTLSF